MSGEGLFICHGISKKRLQREGRTNMHHLWWDWQIARKEM
jgi:hypothetical protein